MGIPQSWNALLYIYGCLNQNYLERLAINVPTIMPVANPKAYIAILTGEETLPHKVTEDETAMTRKSNAVPISALFDFIGVSPDNYSRILMGSKTLRE